MKRRKFTTKFKTKVVLEAIKERETIRELSKRFELAPQQINSWKRDFLSNAERELIMDGRQIKVRPSKKKSAF